VVSQPSTPGRESGAAAAPEGFSGNVVDLVARAAARGPDHPALLEPAGGTRLTWSQVYAATEAEAARLRGAGVRPGDRVLVRMAHGVGFCIALLGALRAGAVVVPAGTHSTERELALIAEDAGPVLLVAGAEDRSSAAVAAGLGRSGVPVLGPPDLGARPEETAVGPVERGGEDVAVLGYTSGTTGTPRGVCLSHRALLANRAQVAQLRPTPVNPADRVLLQLPLFHIYGLGAGLLQVCWAGATGVLVDRLAPAELVEVVGAERITVLAGIPTTYRALLELPSRQLREGLVTVRMCTAGGAPLPAELPGAFTEATGITLHNGYGLTETAPVLTSTLVGGQSGAGSVGRPLPGGAGVPGVELRIVGADGDDEDEFAALDTPDTDEEPDAGLVEVRGPGLFSGYWPDGAGGPDADGWFRTSDVGYLDADGELHLVDRATDLVIVNGFNVYPHEVEQVLAAHPLIAEAAVVGVPDERTGEAVKAVLVLRPGAALTIEQVREHCAIRLARFKLPTVVEFAERLPRSATGKIARMALRGAGAGGAETEVEEVGR
jgi:long-chain acyl-CoA synthetase